MNDDAMNTPATAPNISMPDTSLDDGKAFRWQMLAQPSVKVEAVAPDARPEIQQVAHFAMLCVAMQARLDETDDILQALQYCERVHGYKVIGHALPLIVAALENAVTLIPSTITSLGIQRHLASPGLFMGALVEQLARVPGHTRKFPLSQYRERLRSPHVEFEDCLIAASMARKLGLLSEARPQLVRPYSRLVTEFRKKLGQQGIVLMDDVAIAVASEARAANQAINAVSSFIARVEPLAKEYALTLPAHWRAYVNERKR